MSLFEAFLAALAAAMLLMTLVQTAGAYAALPPRVPLGLTWDGTLRSMAPRPMAWFLPAVQLFCGAVLAFSGWAIATQMPGTHGTMLPLVVDAVVLNAILWRVQSLLLFAARSGQKRVAMGNFWIFVAIAIATILIVSFAVK